MYSRMVNMRVRHFMIIIFGVFNIVSRASNTINGSMRILYHFMPSVLMDRMLVNRGRHFVFTFLETITVVCNNSLECRIFFFFCLFDTT